VEAAEVIASLLEQIQQLTIKHTDEQGMLCSFHREIQVI